MRRHAGCWPAACCPGSCWVSFASLSVSALAAIPPVMQLPRRPALFAGRPSARQAGEGAPIMPVAAGAQLRPTCGAAAAAAPCCTPVHVRHRESYQNVGCGTCRMQCEILMAAASAALRSLFRSACATAVHPSSCNAPALSTVYRHGQWHIHRSRGSLVSKKTGYSGRRRLKASIPPPTHWVAPPPPPHPLLEMEQSASDTHQLGAQAPRQSHSCIGTEP